MPESSSEIVVIGAGPAGASAARLLTSLGHRVSVLTRAAPRPALAESIPPSAQKLLGQLGWADALEQANFLRSTGNTVIWGARHAEHTRATVYANGALGYQVDRGAFNDILLQHLRASDCRLIDGVTVTGVRDGVVTYAAAERAVAAHGERTLRADWVLDCSGRASVVGRAGWRHTIDTQRTLAIAALWERTGGWPVVDATHTIVESHADGWAWSVPLSSTRRHITVMLDPGLTNLRARGSLLRAYTSELSRVPGLRTLTQHATMLEEPFARDASTYHSHRVASRELLLVGDAASFVDPLSSFGIKKALASAWLAAVVAHTCLTEDSMTEAAISLFESRERAMYEALDRARMELARAAVQHDSASVFWAARAEPGAAGALPNEDLDAATLRDDPDVRRAFDELKRRDAVAFRASPALEWLEQPTVRDNRVVLESRLRLASFPRGLRYVRGVDLAKVLNLAPAVRQVPDLYDLYCREVAPVPLADFLGVLSFLVGKRVLFLLDRFDASPVIPGA